MNDLFGKPYEKKMVFSVQILEDRCPHFRNYFQTGATWHSQKREKKI